MTKTKKNTYNYIVLHIVHLNYRDEDEEYDDDRVNFSTKSRENEREEIRDKILRAEHGLYSPSIVIHIILSVVIKCYLLFDLLKYVKVNLFVK